MAGLRETPEVEASSQVTVRLAIRSGLIIILLGGLVYGWARLIAAAGKPMWLDEYHALDTSVRGPSLLRLIVQGAPVQGSPSPLEYILLRGLDNLRYVTRFFGLPPLAYYRLLSVVSLVVSGVVAVSMGVVPAEQLSGRSRGQKLAVAISVACAVVSYWLQPFALEYGTQMRPYALWMAFSLMAYLVALRQGSPWWLGLAWLAVASTTTAALFQIATLVVAYVIVARVSGCDWRETVRYSLLPLIFPLLVGVYYAVHAGKWHYWGPEWGTWSGFTAFWLERRMVGVLSGAGVALCMVRRQTRRFAVPCLGMLFLYASAPLIYLGTRQRGFFFADRQYVYYDLAGPLFMLSAARSLATLEKDSVKTLATALAIGICCPLLTWNLIRGERSLKAARQDLRAGFPSFPVDPEGTVARILRGGSLPAAFCLATETATQGAVRNLELAADWLTVRYSLPVGKEIVHVVANGDGARVQDDRPGKCSYVAIRPSAR